MNNLRRYNQNDDASWTKSFNTLNNPWVYPVQDRELHEVKINKDHDNIKVIADYLDQPKLQYLNSQNFENWVYLEKNKKEPKYLNKSINVSHNLFNKFERSTLSSIQSNILSRTLQDQKQDDEYIKNFQSDNDTWSDEFEICVTKESIK